MADRVKIKIGQIWKFKPRPNDEQDYFVLINRITEQVIGYQYIHKDKTGWCFERDFHNTYDLVSDV
jgi:hypothetical protein